MIDLGKFNIDVPHFRPGSWAAYSVTVALVALATVVRLSLLGDLSGMPYITLFPAVIVVTLFCGSVAALLALALSILIGVLFITGDWQSLTPFYQTMAFAIGSLALIAVAAAIRTAAGATRRLNTTLARSEAKFRRLLESAPDAMIITDAQGRITLVNAETERLFGFARSEVLGKALDLLLPAGAADDPIGVRKDGSEFPAELRMSPLETGDGALVCCAIRDITDRKQIEIRLLEASRAKSEFLSGMSHELRTPLNAVVGFAELLQIRGDTLTEQQREYVEHILEGGNHLLALVTQLLDLAGIEAGRLSLQVGPIDTCHMIERVYRMMQPLAEAARLDFALALPDELPEFQGDELRLRQVLINFVSNAIKYNREGGAVLLSAEAAPQGIRFLVSDTGPGIPPDRVQELFLPFHRLGAEQSGVGGTGIGLAYSKKVVEAMGGAVGFESEVGKGSAFWMEFPTRAAVGAA